MKTETASYRSIIFLAPKGGKSNTVTHLIKNWSSNGSEQIRGKDFKIIKILYLSTKNYSLSADENRHPKKVMIDGIDHYQYQVFVADYSILDSNFFSISAPYSSLLKHLLKGIVDEYKKFKLTYFSINLDLIPALYQDAVPLGGLLRCSSTTLEYLGGTDDRVDNIIISGKNVLISPGFSEIREILRDRNRIARARFELSRNGIKIPFSTDRHGNMAYKVDSDGIALTGIYDIFRFFYSTKAFSITPVAPTLRKSQKKPSPHDELEDDSSVS